KEKLHIITVANLVPVKGVELLIDAVLSVDNAQLTILGDDRSDYAAQLKQKVTQADKVDSIQFLGKHTDVRPFLVQADLYVIPSKKEGMPMALVEAMSMAVPVFGSDISGVNFVLKDFPELLFPASNSNALAEKIRLFHQKSIEDKQELSQQLREYVVKHFSLEEFVRAH